MRLLTRVLLVAAFVLAMLATWQRASAGDSDKPITPKTRRVLYNLDGDSCMWTKKNAKTPVQVTPDDLKTVVDEIASPGSQVDTLLVCINAQCMYYPTKIGDRRGTLATPAERAKWPQSEQQRFRNVEAMFAAGVDPYALLLAEARRHGLEALLTYRMNDIHGDAFLEHKFWLQHPEYRLAKPYDSWAVRHAGLDFGHDAVRDYNFRLIEEAVERYDCDGIELDFVRCPAFFQNGTEAERIAKMNKLVRRVRQMLDAEGKKRGRRLVLAAACFPRIKNAELPALIRQSGPKRAGLIFSPFPPTRARNTICPSSPGKS